MTCSSFLTGRKLDTSTECVMAYHQYDGGGRFNVSHVRAMCNTVCQLHLQRPLEFWWSGTAAWAVAPDSVMRFHVSPLISFGSKTMRMCPNV
eukprot:14982891-Ditylum_brightwellii.AAC.1